MTAWASELWHHRELLTTLTWRDIRVRYKQSLLGVAWAILLPVSLMLVFTFVFTRAIDARSALGIEMPYALYAYSGLVPWTLFSMSLTASVNSLVANRSLVTKVYFPREVFPLSSVAAALVDFAIAMTVLFGLMIYFRATGSWSFAPTAAWLFVPVVLLVQIMLTVGLGMLLAMGNLFYRDVRQIVYAGVQVWMFVSGVVVPVPTDGSLLARLLALNPMVPVIDAWRDCLLFGQLPATGPFIYATMIAALFLVGGWFLFRRASYRFAECI